MHARRRLTLLLLSLAFNGACLCNKTPPPAAPDNLQQNVHWFWQNSDSADDPQLRDAAGKLATAANADTWSKAVEGQSSVHLEVGDIMGFVTDPSAVDPAAARPLLVINEFDCTQAQLESVLTNDDQATLFSGSYTTYVRTDAYDTAAFKAKTLDLATWSNSVANTFPVNDSFTSTVGGTLRRVKKRDDAFTQSDVLIARTWLVAPATFSEGSASYYKQDYEIEIFWEHASGKMFHVYGMWRQVKIGSVGVTLDDNGLLNLVLDNLVTWDGKVQDLCPKQ